MPVVAKRYKIRFEENSLRFSETYPDALKGVLPVPEFDSVIRKINEDLSADVQVRGKKVKRWAYICLVTSIVMAGLCLTPVLFVQTRRQRRELKQFWERVRTYLGEVNRKTYLKRNLEWKLVEDRRKLKTRDVVHPLLMYKIELVHRMPRSGSAARRHDDSSVGVGLASTSGSTSLSAHTVGSTSSTRTGSGSGSGTGSGSRSGSGSKVGSRTGTSVGTRDLSSQNKPLFSLASLADTEPTTRSASAATAGVGTAAAAGVALAAARRKKEEEVASSSDEDDEMIEDDDDDDDDEIFVGSRRFSQLSDDIILEDVDAEEEGEMESGNIASISSSTGVGSYSRGSLIITPMDAAIAASTLAIASSEKREAEAAALTSDKESDATVPSYLFQEPSRPLVAAEPSDISVPLGMFAEEDKAEAEDKAKIEPKVESEAEPEIEAAEEATVGAEASASTGADASVAAEAQTQTQAQAQAQAQTPAHTPTQAQADEGRRSRRISKVRFTGLFSDDETEEEADQ